MLHFLIALLIPAVLTVPSDNGRDIRPISGASGISVPQNNTLQVDVRIGSPQSVTLTGSKNARDAVNSTVSGDGFLTLMADPQQSLGDLKIIVTLDMLDKIEAQGASKMTILDALTADLVVVMSFQDARVSFAAPIHARAFTSVVDGNGTITAEQLVGLKEVSVQLKDNGKITLAGDAEKLTVVAPESGTFKGSKLTTKEADVMAFGKSTVEANASETLVRNRDPTAVVTNTGEGIEVFKV